MFRMPMDTSSSPCFLKETNVRWHLIDELTTRGTHWNFDYPLTLWLTHAVQNHFASLAPYHRNDAPRNGVTLWLSRHLDFFIFASTSVNLWRPYQPIPTLGSEVTLQQLIETPIIFAFENTYKSADASWTNWQSKAGALCTITHRLCQDASSRAPTLFNLKNCLKCLNRCCDAVLLCCCVAVMLVAVLLCCCVAILLWCRVAVLLCCCVAALLWYCVAVMLWCCVAVLLWCYHAVMLCLGHTKWDREAPGRSSGSLGIRRKQGVRHLRSPPLTEQRMRQRCIRTTSLDLGGQRAQKARRSRSPPLWDHRIR